MNSSKIYLFLAFFIISFENYAQSIDPSIISDLSEEQIELARELFDANRSDDIDSDEELSQISESLISNEINNEGDDDSKIKKYGYDFFSTMPTTVSAVGDLPLPNDYKISLRDRFTIILSGSKDATFNLNVKLDGTILFPELGAISVAGYTFQEVKEILTKIVEQSYIGVNIDVSLQNLSAKKITIVGAVQTPGTYLVNPFTTITGALAYSGGISEIGSLRNIKLIRNNGQIFSFDLYELLIKGDRSNDITIEAGDTILINPASKFVEIDGSVRRPAIYEILENETLNNIVEYALGFEDTANKSNISASFLDLKQASITTKTIQNLNQSLKDIIAINVFSYVNKLSSNILVIGAVEEPGYYDVKKYINLSALIEDLKFVDVYPWLAVLEQFDENDLTRSSILINLNDPSTYSNINLLPNSKLFFANIEDRIFSVSELSSQLINDYKLKIEFSKGEIDLPIIGEFSVVNLINYLGIDQSDIDPIATYISPLENKIINMNYKEMRFVAAKYHNISFRSPVNDLIRVSISGEIDYPGTYTLKNDATIRDLYSLVGEFKDQAFFEGIIFSRQNIRDRQIQAIEVSKNEINQALLVAGQRGENSLDPELFRALSSIIEPANLGRIAGDFSPSSPSSREMILLEGDSIFVPKNPNVINVLGEVLNPTAFEFSNNLSLNNAIVMAGGYKEYADKKRVYVIKSNGTVMKTNRNIFIGKTDLGPGDTIVVPRKIISANPITQALLPVTQILSDLAFSAAAIESLSNN